MQAVRLHSAQLDVHGVSHKPYHLRGLLVIHYSMPCGAAGKYQKCVKQLRNGASHTLRYPTSRYPAEVFLPVFALLGIKTKESPDG